MSAVVTEMINILISGITGIAEGVGNGLSTLATSIFLETGEGGAQSLSVFGGLILAFAGISLAIGLCRLVFYWVTSLGNV